MQLNLTKLASALVLSSSLAGCAAMVRTPYEQPAVNMPSSFQNSKAANQKIHADAYADQWWTLFNDAELNQLISQVLDANTDLAVAGINLRQARLQAGLAQDKQGLRVSSSASAGDDSSKGLSLSAGVSYELDLFGKLSSQPKPPNGKP
jgi:outer membrane protein TolC